MQRLAAALLVLVASLAGCAYPVPDEGATAYTAADPVLVAALERAAQSWADQGLIIAGSVVVSDAPGGVPVRFLPRDMLIRTCEATDRQGCVTSTTERITGVWLLAGLSAARLQTVLDHELIHALVPLAPHLAAGEHGIMAYDASSHEPTAADMATVCSFAECVDMGDAGPDASGG